MDEHRKAQFEILFYKTINGLQELKASRELRQWFIDKLTLWDVGMVSQEIEESLKGIKTD